MHSGGKGYSTLYRQGLILNSLSNNFSQVFSRGVSYRSRPAFLVLDLGSNSLNRPDSLVLNPFHLKAGLVCNPPGSNLRAHLAPPSVSAYDRK